MPPSHLEGGEEIHSVPQCLHERVNLLRGVVDVQAGASRRTHVQVLVDGLRAVVTAADRHSMLSVEGERGGWGGWGEESSTAPENVRGDKYCNHYREWNKEKLLCQY